MTNRTAQEIKEAVVERYGSRARGQLAKEETIAVTAVGEESCCGPSKDVVEETSNWADKLYSAQELGAVPKEVTELSLGCGNPTAIAELRPGDAVLDLGSGSGLDCFLAAQQVGPAGRVVGLDMTDDMLELARRNLAKVGATNVEFQKGEMESMPLPENTFDVIISNCVINLSPDKDAVFRESFRVLKPGGRVRVSDIVWTREPTASERDDLSSWAGCIAGALLVDEYAGKLKDAGFDAIDVQFAGEPDKRGWASAYVTATKPSAQAGEPCCGPSCCG
jgi:SAM-dependent methyltransferase